MIDYIQIVPAVLLVIAMAACLIAVWALYARAVAIKELHMFLRQMDETLTREEAWLTQHARELVMRKNELRAATMASFATSIERLAEQTGGMLHYAPMADYVGSFRHAMFSMDTHLPTVQIRFDRSTISLMAEDPRYWHKTNDPLCGRAIALKLAEHYAEFIVKLIAWTEMEASKEELTNRKANRET